MAIQQLDLFGNPIVVPVTKEEPAKAQPAKKQEVTVEDNTPPSFPLFEEKSSGTSSGITVIRAGAASNENTAIKDSPEKAGNEVVYSNNQIRVKVKAERTKYILSEEEAAAYASNNKNNSIGNAVGDSVGSFGLYNVPDDETLNQKLYYKLSIVAEWFGVNNSLLRYWENEFDILKPRLTRKGDRLFRVEDIKNLQLIYQLLKVRKFSIEGAKAYLKQNKQKANVHMELTESLTKFRSFLVELKSSLNA